MLNFTKHFATRPRAAATPQAAPVPGTAQVANSAGGYTWAVTPWQRLDRFLVLGSEGGTFYVGERRLTVENARAVAECIERDGPRVVARVVEVSEAGRAPRNDPALFVLAMAAGMGDAETRAAALEALPRVARTGTHLLHWLEFVQAFRGWGRGVRRAVGRWYTTKDPRELAYQLLKYPQRDGWSHRDALRLAHPRPADAEQRAIMRRAVTGQVDGDAPDTEALRLVRAVAELHADAEVAPARAAALVREHRLTREMVPTQLLASPEVWEALLEGMPLTALVRNLATLTRVGVLAPGGEATARVAARIADAAAL
jgi:60 kDa SS-A/Ro ribonucleoprotein